MLSDSNRKKIKIGDTEIVDWFVCPECSMTFKEGQESYTTYERIVLHFQCWEAKQCQKQK